MEIQPLPEVVENPPVIIDYHSNVDTSRPFSSVKEAVAVFGERFLTGEIYSHKPNFTIFPKQESPWRSSSLYKYSSPPRTPISSKQTSSSSQSTTREINIDDPKLAVTTNTLKKLEAELEESKLELKLLKERESETEVALASLNAELHKNMSKIAQAEAARAVADYGRKDIMIVRKDQSINPSPSLAQILSINGEKLDAISLAGDQIERNKKERKNYMMIRKKKPIIPLVGDLFSRKKGSSLYSS